MRHSGITCCLAIFCAAFGWRIELLFSPLDVKLPLMRHSGKVRQSESLSPSNSRRCLKIMRPPVYALPTAPLSLSPLWCISEVIGALYIPETLLSGYILCCFWLVLVFRLRYVLPWQKVRQVRIELTTLRLWDLRAADCAIVAVSVMVHQWSYWSLVRWCGIPE